MTPLTIVLCFLLAASASICHLQQYTPYVVVYGRLKRMQLQGKQETQNNG
jgi:hypothetical protein